jgi:hypothetical protein
MTLPASRSDFLARRAAGALTFLCTAGAILAAPVHAGPPVDVRVSNISDQGFSVSWVSAVAETGYLRWGTDPASLSARAEDDRGAGVSSMTHHVTIAGLMASTAYYVDVVSGATVDNNNGAHYRVTTGPGLDPPSPAPWAYGQVSRPGGLSQAGILYYGTLRDANGQGTPGDSSLLSGIVKEQEQGYWYLNLVLARLTDLSGRFAYSASGDKLVLRIVGGLGQTLELILDTGAAAPAAPVALPAAPPPATATPPATLTPAATLAPTFTATPPVATPSPPPGAATATVTPAPSAPPFATATPQAVPPTGTPSRPVVSPAVSPVATVAIPPVPTGAPATPIVPVTVPVTVSPDAPSPTALATASPSASIGPSVSPSPTAAATAAPAAAPPAIPSQPLPDWLPAVLFAAPVAAVMLYLAARLAHRS